MFKIGCDPEIFLVDKKTNEVISAEGFVEGTKKSPEKVAGGAVQVDGIALELNTDPVDLQDFNAFNRNIVSVMKSLEMRVKTKNPSAKFSITPTMPVTQDFLDGLSETSKELGCDPDFNAYTLEANPMPDGDRLFRTGAGHLHVGWGADIPTDNREHFEICADFVKMLDATVGIVMTILDTDPRRRELYGKAGAFRPKHYGVEYRTPSNVWLRSLQARRCVFQALRTGIDYKKAGYSVESFVKRSEEEVRNVIDTGDVETARTILGSRFSYELNERVKFAEADFKRLEKKLAA